MDSELSAKKELPPGEPQVPIPVTDEVNLSVGDHVLYQIGSEEYRKGYRSALVSYVDDGQRNIKIITFTREGIQESQYKRSLLPNLHRIEYFGCLFSPEVALSRALRRRDMGDNIFHPLNNNGHHFMANVKTGRENALSDITIRLETQTNEPEAIITPVVFKRVLKDISDVRSGQHVLITKVFEVKKLKAKMQLQHLLVESCNKEENKFLAYFEENGTTKRKWQKFPTNDRLFTYKVFEIVYEREFYPVVGADLALQRANSTLSSEKHEVPKAEAAQAKKRRDPMMKQNEVAHGSYEIDDCETEQSNENESTESKAITNEPAISLHASRFVTKCLTGEPLAIDESCLQEYDAAPISHTRISQSIGIDEGDHMAIKIKDGEYCQCIVLRVMGEHTMLTIPNLNGEEMPTGIISIGDGGPEVFRINYKHSVSADQTKKRACSEIGKKIMKEKGVEYLVTWAKTGKSTPVNMLQIMEKEQLKQVRPLFKERITDANQVKVGDHLIQWYTTYWFHFLVSEIDPNDPNKLKCIYCLRTYIAECDLTLNMRDNEVYRIEYFESFSPNEAIRRARSKLGTRTRDIFARLQFVRWAKTGSDEGIEIDFLINHTLPLSKSEIQSFAQLNRGDAIVKKEKVSYAHYYIVTEVLSPTTCMAVESYYGIQTVTLTCDPGNKNEVFYRLNYYPGACFSPDDAVKRASYFAETCSTTMKVLKAPTPKRLTRGRFINFVKTGDNNSVDSDKLMNDRELSIRTLKVTSALELLPGDHIKRPARKPLPKGSFHHMMVAEKPDKAESCVVHHFSGEKSKNKARIAKAEEMIFKEGPVYRIHYPERIDPSTSLQVLEELPMHLHSQSRSSDDIKCARNEDMASRGDNSEATVLIHDFVEQNKGKYHLLSNNCEHLIMFVSVRTPLSIQISEMMFEYLEYYYDGIQLSFTQAAFAKLTTFKTKSALTFASNNLMSACQVAGAATGTAIAKASLRTAVTEGAEAVADVVTISGYNAAVRSISFAIGSTVAVGSSLIIELPFFARGIYKTYRKKKFDQITAVESKKEYTKQISLSAGMVVGGASGAMVGTLIPVPFLGTLLGATAGSLIGMAAGKGGGLAISRFFKEGMIPDFVILQTHLYEDFPLQE